MSSTLVITLPVPDYRISPNGSRGRSLKAVHAKARRVKSHREKAKVLTDELIGLHFHKKGLTVPTFVGYSAAFFFPNAQRRDDDNADASLKSYRDGIGDALKIDDHRLPKVKLSTIAKDAANPRVEITLHLALPD